MAGPVSVTQDRGLQLQGLGFVEHFLGLGLVLLERAFGRRGLLRAGEGGQQQREQGGDEEKAGEGAHGKGVRRWNPAAGVELRA